MTSPLRVIVADDELMARKRLLRLLREMDDVVVVGECENGSEVLAAIARLEVDVVLLDICMPGLNGIETLRLLPEDGPYVVFCTAHAEHAVDAYDAGAIDYVLKPVEAERLEKALARARSREARQRFHDEVVRQRPSLNRIPIPTRDGIVLLDPNDISHAVLDAELVTIVTVGARYLSDSSLQELEERLPRCFMRVHRRALVNLERIVRLEPNDAGGFVARTVTGDGVIVSRQAARDLRRQLGLRAKPDDPVR